MFVSVILLDKVKKLACEKGDNLLSVLLKNNIKIDTACGGRGACLKCKVKVISGKVTNASMDSEGYVLSCMANVESDLVIEVKNKYQNESQTNEVGESKNYDKKVVVDSSHNFGIAFDLGTTTLAFSLVDVTDKKVVDSYSVLNKQSQFGADVISRISASTKNLDKLYSLINKQLSDAVDGYIKKYEIKIDKVIVSGNTTMLHLFCNVSPESIGYSPFTPVFLQRKTFSGSSLGINCNSIEVLPSCSAFVGADITSGVLATGMESGALLVDLGTNGEIIYKGENKYYATSTAAGPCLEGACIDCGVGGIDGAVSQYSIKNGKAEIKTINDKKPIGICGAGLIDIIASLLQSEVIDSSGALNSDKYVVSGDIFLSSADVRQYQLAKSAIKSGIETLLYEIGKSIGDVTKLYLAGGIGYHINVKNAIASGILPDVDISKVEVCGNSSLQGARMCLLDGENLKKMDEIASNCENIDLNSSAYFGEAYINNMMFE